MAETTNHRLDRIEEKLSGLKEDHDRAFERMNRLSQKLDEIQAKVDDNAHTVRVINKLFWVAVVAISGSIAAQVWM